MVSIANELAIDIAVSFTAALADCEQKSMQLFCHFYLILYAHAQAGMLILSLTLQSTATNTTLRD